MLTVFFNVIYRAISPIIFILLDSLKCLIGQNTLNDVWIELCIKSWGLLCIGFSRIYGSFQFTCVSKVCFQSNITFYIDYRLQQKPGIIANILDFNRDHT